MLNFQGIQFSRVVTSLENLIAAKNFVSENFHVRKWREQFRGTRKISVSADIKDIWEAAVGEHLCVRWSLTIQGTGTLRQ